MNFYGEAIESKLEAHRVSSRAVDDGFERDFDHRRKFGKYERGALRRAIPYFWSAPITAAVLESSKTLPDDTAVDLSKYRLGESIWFWFEKAMALIPWRPPFHAILGTVARLAEDREVSIILTTYGHNDPSPGLQALDTVILENKMTLARVIGDVANFTEDKAKLANEIMRKAGDAGVSGPGACLDLFRFFASSLLWIEQEIVPVVVCRPDRASAKRISRAGSSESDIKVIELRRRASVASGEHDDAETEWSCQWVVRGHWRQQFYPSTGERRPLWILPYVKGNYILGSLADYNPVRRER